MKREGGGIDKNASTQMSKKNMQKLYRFISDHFVRPLDSLFYYASWDNIWKFFLKCPLGLHEPYPDYYYPSCWVCGRRVFMEQHKNFVEKFDRKP